MTFKRRANLSGNTDSARTNQPHILGYEQKDSSGEFPAMSLPAELRLETEASGGPVSVSFTTDKLMSTIVGDINTQMAGFAEAEDRDGVLLIRTLGSGDGAFIRTHPQILGFDDTTFVFGFPRYPDPLSTVYSGDELQSPSRPDLQANPVGTGMVAFGEDRAGSSYNRALQLLARNSDFLYTQLNRPIATVEIIEIEDTPYWSTRLYFNIYNELDQIDLSDLGTLDPKYEGRRIYVGNLSNTSTLEEIRKYFSLQDGDDKDLLNIDAKVGIAGITRGLRPGLPPAFPAPPDTETSPPTSVLPDTSGAAPDGGNALGVDRQKHAPVVISAIYFRSNVFCPGATFVTRFVRPGDKAIITLADIDVPFNHNGEYIVDTVVSEEELVLRSNDPSKLGELNPDDTGVFGSIEIRSGGEFEEGLFATVWPKLTRFPPPSGKIRLVIGMETTPGARLVDASLLSAIRTSEEVDSFTLLEIKRRLTLDGIYNGGQANAPGAGAFAKVTGRPFTASVTDAYIPGGSALTVLRSHTSEILANNVLRAEDTDTFTIADVGRIVLLDGPGIPVEKTPFYITKLLDGEHVELARYNPTDPADTPDITATFVNYSVCANINPDAPAAFQVISSDASTAGGWGYLFDRRYNDGLTGQVPGSSFLHLERVKLHRDGTNISTFDVTIAGADLLDLPFDPEDTHNIRPETQSQLVGSHIKPGSLLRVHNGLYIGLYRIARTWSGLQRLQITKLDGTAPALVDDGTNLVASVYNIHMGTKVPYSGQQGTGVWYVDGLHLFQDNFETGANGSPGNQSRSPVLSVDWRGEGSGIRAWLNDGVWHAYDTGDGAIGPFMFVRNYAPAGGIFIRSEAADSGVEDRRHTYSIDVLAKTFYEDYDIGDSLNRFKGFAGRFFQNGLDPALIVGRDKSGTLLDPPLGLPIESAAFGLVSASGITGRGSAAEISGSVYQRRSGGNGGPTWDDGGIFTESVVGAGRYLYPLQSYSGAFNAPLDEAYWGVTPYEGFAAPTALGWPGQVLPLLDSGSPIATTFHARDYAKFNLDHTGYFALGGLVDQPISKWVGLRIYVDPSSGGSYDEEEYVIIAVNEDGDVAVQGSGGGPIPPGSEAANVIVRGQRWHNAYLNIGDWALIGARFELGTEEKLPVLTAGTPHLQQQFRTIDAPGYTGGGAGNPFGTENLRSMSPYYPNAYGTGVGLALPLLLMPGINVAPGAYAGGWRVPAGEPRSPFPNTGIFSSDNPAPSGIVIQGNILDATHKGNLTVDDFAMDHLVQNSPNGVIAGFSGQFGGCLRLASHPDNVGATDDTVRLYMRGTKVFPETKYALRALLLVWLPAAAHNIELELVRDDGTVIETSGSIPVDCTDDTPAEVFYDFENYDLNNAAYNKLIGADGVAETLAQLGVHLAVTVSLNEGGGITPRVIEFLKMELFSTERAARTVGPVDILGTIRAQAYRRIAPVIGYQTVTPMDVDLLNRHEFGRIWESEVEGGNNQALEGHGVGLILSPGGEDNWYMPTFNMDQFFRKGPHNAAIWFYHPFFDPLWYVSVNPTASSNRVLPMPTGFMGKLNPPHGSRLSSLHWGLSFSPAVVSDNVDPGDAAYSHWGVYRSTPGNGSSEATFKEQSTWEPRAGAVIRLWRYNTLDFDTVMPIPDVAGYPGTLTPECGWAQEIWSRDIDLSGVTPPPFSGGGSNSGQGNEYFEKGGIDLRNEFEGDPAAESLLTVDRRHYGYMFTVEFYGGPRVYFSEAVPAQYGYFGDLAIGDTAPWRVREVTRNTYIFPSIEVGHPADADPSAGAVGGLASNGNLGHPPAVKFRGLRLGWVTDRAGDGGWG